MKRLLTMIATLTLPLIASVAFAGPYDSLGLAQAQITPDSGKSSCQAKLSNNAYDCTVARSFSGPFSDCFQFISPGSVSGHFDLIPAGLGATLGCACDPTGSVNSPTFNASSSSFTCTGDDGISAFSFAGKVSNNSMKGHAESDPGDTFIYGCKKRTSACF
jgi:hypothetical protein